MLKGEQLRTMTRRIAADAPVQRGRSAEGVVPLAPTGAVAQYQRRKRSCQSLALPVRFIIAPASADKPAKVVRALAHP